MSGSAILAIVLVFAILMGIVWLGVSYWAAKDAKRRGSRHHLAWGIGVFMLGLIGLLLYIVVRDEMGHGGGTY